MQYIMYTVIPKSTLYTLYCASSTLIVAIAVIDDTTWAVAGMNYATKALIIVYILSLSMVYIFVGFESHSLRSGNWGVLLWHGVAGMT